MTQRIVLIVWWGSVAVSDCGFRTGFSNLPPPPSWAQPFREKTDLGSGFTGLLIWSLQFCTQINGSAYFLLSEVEQVCSHAEMKQRGLMRSFTSTLFIPLQRIYPFFPDFHPPHSFSIPSTILSVFPPPSRHCLFRFITRVSLPLVSSWALSQSRGGSDLPERTTPHFWMRWHPPWWSWREVRRSRMRCRAHVGLPITRGRGEMCGHITVFIITTFPEGDACESWRACATVFPALPIFDMLLKHNHQCVIWHILTIKRSIITEKEYFAPQLNCAAVMF